MRYKLDNYSLQDNLASVKEFMDKAGQITSLEPRVPSSEERVLRAKLIFEEAIETIRALGVDYVDGQPIDLGVEHYNILEVLDGACDITVVTNGTLIACGLTNVFPEALRRVNENNLTKVGEGSYLREDGKVMKPPNYKPVNLKDLI